MNESQPYNPDDELLSAYLDGELAPEERARVESRLASDPEARHLLEELRAASKALQGLPSAAIDHSLREAVLERVAKATNSDDDAPIAPTGAPVGPRPGRSAAVGRAHLCGPRTGPGRGGDATMNAASPDHTQ